MINTRRLNQNVMTKDDLLTDLLTAWEETYNDAFQVCNISRLNKPGIPAFPHYIAHDSEAVAIF